MTQLIYKVGDTYFTSYAMAMAHKEMTGDTMVKVFQKPEQYTAEQKEKFKIHAEKAKKYRAEHK